MSRSPLPSPPAVPTLEEGKRVKCPGCKQLVLVRGGQIVPHNDPVSRRRWKRGPVARCGEVAETNLRDPDSVIHKTARAVRRPVPLNVLTLDEIDRRYTLAVLEKCGGHRRMTADLLGISLRTLGLRLKRYAMEEEIREDMAVCA